MKLIMGEWRVDVTASQISRGDQVVRVDARLMRLLTCLAERAGELVTTDELLEEVWSGVVVTQDSVYQAIASLRRLLGDDPKRPSYIATVPRQGYRLIAPVNRTADTGSNDGVSLSATATSALAKRGTAAPGTVASTLASATAPAAATSTAASDSAPPAVTSTLASDSAPAAAATPASPTAPAAAAAPTSTTAPSTAAVRAHAPADSARRWRLAALLAIGAVLCIAQVTSVDPRATPAAWQQKSVAVLPFLDLTTESMDQEYFADGLTEELIDDLSRVPGLKVPSATASFYFKGKQMTVANIARDLRVAYVVDGSLRKAGATLRVAARLVRADNGYVVWSGTYDRESNNVLTVQRDVANEVTRALQATLQGLPDVPQQSVR